MPLNRTEVQEILQKTDLLRDREGRLEAALNLVKDIFPELDSSTEEYYEVLLRLSALYRDNKSYILSENLLKKGVSEAKKFNMPIYLADIYRSLSFIQIKKGKEFLAKRYARKALNVIKDIKGFEAQKVEANTYAVLGNIYFGTKDYKKALSNYEQALDVSKQIGFDERRITITGDIANVYIATGNLKQARGLLLSIKKDSKKIYKISLPQILLRLARIEFQEHNYQLAEKYTKEVVDISEKEGWQLSLVEAKEGLAKIYMALDKKGESKKLLKEAVKIYKSIGLNSKAESIEKTL